MRLSLPRALLVATAALALPAPPASAQDSDWPHVDPLVAPALRGVLRQAAARLSTPDCSALLFDFDDFRTGRPLAETLARSGLDLEGWLRSVYFLNGDGRSGCAGRRTFAYTPRGSHVVWVCPLALENLRRSKRGLTATVLIHETLHTLGLSEDPPSSEEITLRVESRCGR
ncbi:MAG: hypothetical protein KJ062_09620 [Thermoanaerobaculia bacterium]|nr:hypothetical protein [Thermoanaerobaculia bacterium]